jgi:replicative DNA helicase Mcm
MVRVISADNKKIKYNPCNVSQALRLSSGYYAVPGVITGVTQVYHMIKSAHAICSTCLVRTQIYEYKPPINFSTFRFKIGRRKCPNGCDGTLQFTTETIPAITIEIRDPDSTNDLESIKTIVFGKNTNDVVIGETVMVKGLIAVTESRDKGYSVIYAKSMSYENKREVKVSNEDIKAIYEFAESRIQNKDVVKDLVPMVAPSVIGHMEKKEGMLLSAVMTPEDKPRRKTRIHILFLGPPGEAKTELLHGSADLVPGSTVQSGQGSTGLSLTAMIVKEDDATVLRIGPIPRGRGKIVCINELNKQSYLDQDKILDFMQEGESNINKFGKGVPIRGPSTIHASANPFHGDFTRLDGGRIDVNEITIQPAVRDRFDLVFIFKAESERDRLLEYADNKGRLLNQDEVPICPPFLVKYIMFAKTFNPKISDEAMSILNKCYADLASTNRISKRKLQTLYNLAIARAKLKLKDLVDEADARETVDYYNKITEDYNTSAVVAVDPRDATVLKIEEILEQNSMSALTSGPMTFSDLIIIACEQDLQVKLYIGPMLSMTRNKKLRQIAQLLEANPRVKRTKTRPLTFQWIPVPISAPTPEPAS